MKLHLPKLLRHAVLACIAAVAGVASTVGTAAITSGAVTFALLGSYAEAAVPNATYTDDGTTRTYTGTGIITVPAADSGITKIVFGMSEPGSGDNRSYFNAGFTCNTAVQIGTSAGNGIDINDGSSSATYAFTGAISGEGIWRVMGSPTSKTKITGSMEGFTGQLIGGTAPTFQLATTCKASVVDIGKLQLVGNVAFTGGSAGDHASITLGNVTSDADTQLTLGEYTETTLNGTIALRKSIVNNGSITLGDNVVFDLANLAAVDGVYRLFTNAVDLSGLDASAVLVNLSDGKAITLNTDGTISVVEGTVGNRIWKNNGASDTWAAVSDLNWTADGADAFFVNGCTVQFGESASATGETIEMVNNLNIGGMTVYGTGWEFAGSSSITSTGKLTIEANATVKYSTSGTVSVTSVEMKTGSALTLSGTKLTATAPTADVNLGTIKLESGKYYVFCNASKRKTSIEQLDVSGSSFIGTTLDGNSHDGVIEISALNSVGNNASLKLENGSNTSKLTLVDINGGAYTGDIILDITRTNTIRRLGLNLNHESVAENAVIKLTNEGADGRQFGIGLGQESVKIAGLDGNTNTAALYGFKLDAGQDRFFKQEADTPGETGRTLEIGVAASGNYSSNITVSAGINLAKSGAGTQSFTGDLSAFNGTISVSEGVLNMSSIGSASSISLTSSGATLGVTGSTTTGEGDAAVTTPNSVNLTSGKSLSVVNGTVLNSALTLGGGALALGTDSSAWATDNGLSLNNHALVFGADKTELSLNLGSVALAAGDTIDLFKNVASVELATGATLDTYFSGLAEALKTATLSLAEGRLVATLAAAYESSAPSSATIQLAMPPSGVDNGGHGSTNATAALTKFANLSDGGYMFNNGGGAGTNAETGEGILTTTDGVTSITLAPRAGAGGTGEVIVLSGTELNGYEVDSFTFSIASSNSDAATGNIALTLAVVEGVVGGDGSTTWSVSGDTATGSLTIGSGASVTLDLAESITWSELYKVVAMMDNTGKLLQGGNGALYTLSGISISASLSGSTLPLQMPDSVAEATQTTGWGATVESAINTAKSKAYGYYVGPASSNAIDAASWTTPTITINDRVYKEGSWDNETGIVVLAGRSGVSGLVASFVLGEELEAGSTVSAITFNAAGYADNLSGDVQIGLGIRDATGNAIGGITDVTGSFSSTSTETTSITLGGSVEWAAGYKIIAVIKGLSGTATTAYAITNVSLSYQLDNATPPPAGATDYYWESGAGNWSDAKWSTTDGATSGQTTLPSSGTVNVVFNNAADDASISIGTGVSVNDMSVTAGTYTFTGDEAATLEVAGKLTVGSGATANIETAVEVGSIEVAGTLGISQCIKVAENGTVTLDADGTINLRDFEPTTSTSSFDDSENEFGTTTNIYKVFDGGSFSGTIGKLQIDDTPIMTFGFNAVTGEYTIVTEGKIYGVGTGTVNSSSVTGAEGIALNGGELVLDAAPTEAGFITATEKGGTLDLNGKTVEQSALGILAGATVLEGNAASIYDLGAEKALASNLSLSDTDWKGTVKMGDIDTPSEDLDISSLGRTGSSIKMGAVSVNKLTSSSAAAVQADSLTLGAASEVSGELTLTSNTLTLGSAEASLTAASLETTSGDLTIAAVSQDVLDALNTKASQGAIPILTLTADDFDGDLTQSEIVVPTRAAAPVEKYFTELQWNADKTQLSYASRVNPDYVDARVEASTQNGLAGVALLQQALQQVNPQVTAPDSALAAVLNAVDAGELSEEGAAAVAGAATAVLGMAAHGDLDRQLQAIRNRTTTMGVDQSVVHHDMPYFNAWINAEGDYSELSDDGTEGGYKLNSWGGTVGFDVDITPTFTAGMALTAMYGDLDVTGADTASGELNTYYVSAFARYCASAWTHTFVATAGLSDITLDRTVMGEEIEGETDGVSFGLMYEVGRVFALDEDGTACLQPIFNVTWRHTQVNGYEESGSDLALEVDDQTLDTVTFGVGARLQAIVGESMYNRTSIFECRLLAKFDAGDRQGSSDVALAALRGNSQEVESAERGPIGLEAGAGLTIPLGDEGGSLFMDASLELRADYTNVNGTVGYRINF